MLDITTASSSAHHHHHHINDVSTTTTTTKRKRRPAGTPDPEAEVVSLSPKTLLESDRYVCEICGQGFQRDQNLQMHRRRHKVPWKLLKREATGAAVKKRVFVCPEKSCLHHDPSHALGDLVGIKKHFRRKHSTVKQWACSRCSKAYAVQSDFKAHLKTCGTRGHSCDCGRVFSRVESFIEHQDSCTVRPEVDQLENAKLFSGVNAATITTTGWSSRTASSTSPSSDANFRHRNNNNNSSSSPASLVAPTTTEEQEHSQCQRFLELQLLPPSSTSINRNEDPRDEHLLSSTRLKLSIGSSSLSSNHDKLENCQKKVVSLAMAEKAYAEEARREAKRQIAMAEAEFGNAKRIRQQARSELERAQLLREQATKKISSTMLQITCQACKQAQFQDSLAAGDETTSLAMSYTDGEEGE